MSRTGRLSVSIDEIPVKVIHSSVAASTNAEAVEYARANQVSEPVVFIADEQTAGRGRLGRSFISPRGGLYMSILTPVAAGQSPTDLTVYAAVIASRTLASLYGVSPEIKWVNDIYLGGKKLAGILTQGVVSPEGVLTHAVMGIGINVLGKSMPEELCDIATSLEIEGVAADVRTLGENLACRYLEEIGLAGSAAITEEYSRRSFIVGCEIEVIAPDGSYPAKAIRIGDACELIIELPNGERKALSSGDVSVRRR